MMVDEGLARHGLGEEILVKKIGAVVLSRHW
jgi:hypothetical protein